MFLKRYYPFLVSFFVSVFLSWLAITQKDGFSLSLIQNPLVAENFSDQEEDFSLLTKIFSQPFVYLGKGRQTFVFESADGNVVLKFFNQRYFQYPWHMKWAEPIPFLQSWVEKEKAKRNLRKEFYLNSYRIALSQLQEDSGILFAHFGTKKNHLPNIRLKDKGGMVHSIDLNGIPFVLQKKGIPFYQALDDAYASEGLPGLQRILDGFIDSLAGRIAKKIADGDQDVEHNWGVVDNRVFHLDPGRLYINEDLQALEISKTEWERSTRCLNKWLKKRYPAASTYLEKKVQANIEETIREPIARPFPISRVLQKDESLQARFAIS